MGKTLLGQWLRYLEPISSRLVRRNPGVQFPHRESFLRNPSCRTGELEARLIGTWRPKILVFRNEALAQARPAATRQQSSTLHTPPPSLVWVTSSIRKVIRRSRGGKDGGGERPTFPPILSNSRLQVMYTFHFVHRFLSVVSYSHHGWIFLWVSLVGAHPGFCLVGHFCTTGMTSGKTGSTVMSKLV